MFLARARAHTRTSEGEGQSESKCILLTYRVTTNDIERIGYNIFSGKKNGLLQFARFSICRATVCAILHQTCCVAICLFPPLLWSVVACTFLRPRLTTLPAVSSASAPGLLLSVLFCIRLRSLQSTTFCICPRSVAVCIFLYLPSVGYSLCHSASALGHCSLCHSASDLGLLQSATFCTCPRSVAVCVYRHLYSIRCCLCTFASTSLCCCLRLSASVRPCLLAWDSLCFCTF